MFADSIIVFSLHYPMTFDHLVRFCHCQFNTRAPFISFRSEHESFLYAQSAHGHSSYGYIGTTADGSNR